MLVQRRPKAAITLSSECDLFYFLICILIQFVTVSKEIHIFALIKQRHCTPPPATDSEKIEGLRKTLPVGLQELYQNMWIHLHSTKMMREMLQCGNPR